MGMHLPGLHRDQITTSLKYIWVMQWIQIFNYAFGKIAVIAFIMELQGLTWKKMRVFLTFLAVSNVSAVITHEQRL